MPDAEQRRGSSCAYPLWEMPIMDTIPEPLVSPSINLANCGWGPMYWARIFGSELYVLSTGDEFKAAFTLWGKAWQQVPAGSLPSDDRVLCNLANYGRDMDGWLKVKDMALRGFKLCTQDGRLYHPVVAEMAQEAYELTAKKQEQARQAGIKSGESRRRKRVEDDYSDEGEPAQQILPGIETNAVPNAVPNENERLLNNKQTDRQTNQHTDKQTESGGAPRAPSFGPQFAKFWARYPHKVGKHGPKGARAAFGVEAGPK
jgi:hypothetical protein